jgi:hypothetical protein
MDEVCGDHGLYSFLYFVVQRRMTDYDIFRGLRDGRVETVLELFGLGLGLRLLPTMFWLSLTC